MPVYILLCMFGLGLQDEDKVQTDFFVFGPGRKFKGPKINPVSGVCGTPPSEGLEQYTNLLA